jgi:thioredoxin-related protein
MNYICFTTTSCPKCPEFKSFIAENIKFEGEILDETKPNFMEIISSHNVTAAPTILIFDSKKEVFRTSEIYELGEFLKKTV